MSRRCALALAPALLLFSATSAGPARADSTRIRPVVAGVMSRTGPASGPAAPTVNSFVIVVNWADLQPTQDPGTDHGGDLDTSAIDSALSTVTPGQTVRLRVMAGLNAPAWAKTLDGPAMNWYDPTSGVLLGTIGAFWTTHYGDAYDDLQTKLANLYDGDPRLQEVAISRCTTQFAEPFIRQYGSQANLTELQAAGYTVAADHQCQDDEIRAHATIWLHTRSSLAFSPFQNIDTTFQTKLGTVDEPYTESVMDECRAILGARCVLGNNGLTSSLGTTPGDPYTSMLTHMQALGGPIYFQTATNAKIGDWRVALQRAVDLGADSVELPLGYANWPLADVGSDFGLTHYDGLLEANAAAVDSVDTTPPTAPTGLQSTAVSGTSVSLSWDAASDDVAVTGYNVYRDGLWLASTPGTSYADVTVAGSTTYVYAVTAVDAAANESPQSSELDVTTADISPPTAPTALQSNGIGATSVGLGWQAATDDIGVTGYNVYRDGSLLSTTSGTSFTDASVADGTSYSYSVTAVDAAGNESLPSSVLVVTTPDVTPPTVPTSLQSNGISATSATLSWSPATDKVGVTGYRVYRDGAWLATTSTASYTDATVVDGKTYTYSVTAIDAAGNQSAPTAGLDVTIPDVTPPTTPTGLHTTAVSATSVGLAWSPATDNVGVTGYRVYRNGTLLATTSGLSLTDATIANGASYTYTVTAIDAAANESAASAMLSVGIPDTTAPTAPTGLQATTPSPTQVNLTWSPSSDNVGVVSYTVFRGATKLGTSKTASYVDKGVKAKTTYTYTVTAVDAAGNVSSASAGLRVTTPATSDTQAPSVPQGVKATAVTGKITVQWKASTDNVGVAGYTIYRGGVALATTTSLSFADTSVKKGTAYTYDVVAFDAAGNASKASAKAKVTAK